MNGYLVVMRCLSDDIPILLTDDRERAYDFARAIKEGDEADAANVLQLDASEVSNVSVFDFVDGVLAGFDVVKDFDDE